MSADRLLQGGLLRLLVRQCCSTWSAAECLPSSQSSSKHISYLWRYAPEAPVETVTPFQILYSRVCNGHTDMSEWHATVVCPQVCDMHLFHTTAHTMTGCGCLRLSAGCSQAHLFLIETVASLVLLGLGRLIFLPDHYLEMLVRHRQCLYIMYAGNCLRYMANQSTCIGYPTSLVLTDATHS